MYLRALPIEIPTEKGGNPFRYDKLNRRPSAESLTNVLSATPGPLVCAVDGGWGAGKTTFLKMWRQHLKNQHFSTVYFSAWESDFADDALISLIGELDAAMGEFGLKGDALTGAKGLLDGVTSLVPSLLRASTAGMAGGGAVLAGATAEYVSGRIKHYTDASQNFEAFKKQMEGFAKAVSGEAKDGTHKPLVVIIDELDRCRPSYAIQVLERVKHLFDVPNMVFVMAMNKAEMAHSVKAVYGEGMDAEGYLRRFFDLEFLLPPPADDVFLESLFSRFGMDECFGAEAGKGREGEREQLVATLLELTQRYQLTLRDLEQCFSQLAVVLMSTSPQRTLYTPLLGLLLVIKKENSTLYGQLIDGRIRPLELIEKIEPIPKTKAQMGKNVRLLWEALLASCHSGESGVENSKKRYQKWAHSLTPPRPVAYRDGVERRIWQLFELGFDYSLREFTDQIEAVGSFRKIQGL